MNDLVRVVLETAGLTAVLAGLWLIAGPEWVLMVGGAMLYLAALGSAD